MISYTEYLFNEHPASLGVPILLRYFTTHLFRSRIDYVMKVRKNAARHHGKCELHSMQKKTSLVWNCYHSHLALAAKTLHESWSFLVFRSIFHHWKFVRYQKKSLRDTTV